MTVRSLQTLLVLVLTALWSGALGYMHWRGDAWFLDRIEAPLTDFRTMIRGPRQAPDLITIVAIDDETVRQAGSYPLPRATLAQLVESVAARHPKLVAVDILLLDAGPQEGDQALARSLAAHPSVIAAAATFASSSQRLPADADDPLSEVPIASDFLLPQAIFRDAAAMGIVNVTTDGSGTPRLAPMLFRKGEEVEPSFPLRVASLVEGHDPVIEEDRIWLGDRVIRTDAGQLLPLDFFGPRGTIRTISASKLLDGSFVEDLRDQIVVVGATVTGGGDVYPTPFDPVLPGVEVLSTAIADLTNGAGLVRDRDVRSSDAIVAMVLPLALVGLLAWRRSLAGFAAMLAVLLAWIAINFVAFTHGIWMSMALPLVAAIPPVLLVGAGQVLLGRRRALHFARQSLLLQQVHAPGMEKWLAEHGEFLKHPVRQDAAIVFIDISGFTGLSETTAPQATSDLLNGFYVLVDEEASRCGGVVTGFMGDGAMIVFGLPTPGDDDARSAAQCCNRLALRTDQWLSSLPAAIAARIGFKIGAHYGPIVASRLGADTRQHVTVTGDTVNVASRLMEVAARQAAVAAISDDLWRVAGPDNPLLTTGRLTGPIEVQIRGRSGALAVWLWGDPAPVEEHAYRNAES